MVRPDDASIPDDIKFLRALTRDDWWKAMEDKVRVSSIAFYTFDEEPGETSCYLDTPVGRLVFERQFPGCHAARFTAANARTHGFNVTRDPEGCPEKSQEHFVLTHPVHTKRNPYQSACKQLALLSKFTTYEELLKELNEDPG